MQDTAVVNFAPEKHSVELRELWAFFHPTIRRLAPSGRLIVLGTPPEDCTAPREATA